MKTNTPKQIPLSEYKDMVFHLSKINHIWLDAFSCVNPSDEFLKDVGRVVLERLNNKDWLISEISIIDEMDATGELEIIESQLILRVNKS